MNIASPRIEELAQRLASATGEDVETALARALEERLSRVAQVTPARRCEALETFFEAVSRMPVRDSRPIDQIIGYGDDGLPG